jgi:hypothetical protein
LDSAASLDKREIGRRKSSRGAEKDRKKVKTGEHGAHRFS